MWVVNLLRYLQLSLFVNFLPVLRQTMRFKKYSSVESDAYGFEHVLAFVAFHPWANSKWVIDQSEHVLYFCYAIKKYNLFILLTISVLTG